MSERHQVLAIAMLLGEKWGDCLMCRGGQETRSPTGMKLKCTSCHGTGFDWLCKETMEQALAAGHYSKLPLYHLPAKLLGP